MKMPPQPELPEPTWRDSNFPSWSEIKLRSHARAYAEQCVRAAISKCADVCDHEAELWEQMHPFNAIHAHGCMSCASAIRALMDDKDRE